MHVLFLSAWYPYPPDNGSKTRGYHLLGALAERHDVDLVTFMPPEGAAPNRDLVAEGLCARMHVVRRAPYVAHPWLRRLGILSPIPSHMLAYRSIEMRRLAASAAAEAEVDVVIASTGLVAPLAVKLPVLTRVLEEHNFLGGMLWERHNRAGGPVRRLRTWLTWRKDLAWERRLFKRFHLVTMVSEADRNAVRTMNCDTSRLEVVPNGVDVAACDAVKVPTLPGAVIYPGAITYAANCDAVKWFARSIWPTVFATHPSARFIVTGRTNGVDVTDLESIPGMSLTGYLEDVRSAIAASSACVIPLRHGGGSRLKVLEAMALGVPVVSTTKGIEGLGIEPGRHCLVADSAEAFARDLGLLMTDVDLRKRLAGAARSEIVPLHDWGPISAHFVDLVEETVAGQP